MLKTMLCKQLELQQRLDTLPGQDYKKVTNYIKDNTVYIMSELDELLRELPFFKPWKSYENFNISAHKQLAKEEFIDVIHFVLNIAIALEMSAEEIFSLYMDKNEKNHTRQDEGYGKIDE